MVLLQLGVWLLAPVELEELLELEDELDEDELLELEDDELDELDEELDDELEDALEDEPEELV